MTHNTILAIMPQVRKALIVIRAGKGLSSQEGLDESEIVVQFSVPLIFFCMADGAKLLDFEGEKHIRLPRNRN